VKHKTAPNRVGATAIMICGIAVHAFSRPGRRSLCDWRLSHGPGSQAACD
jgi:hypothetical protein